MVTSRTPARVYAAIAAPLLAWSCDGASREPRGPDDHQAAGGIAIAAVTRRDSVPAADKKLAASLLQRLAAVPADTHLTVVVDMRSNVDPPALAAHVSTRARTRRERRALALRVIRAVAHASQLRLRPTLDSLVERRAVGAYRAFAVANRLIVSGTPAALRALARHSEVATIFADEPTASRVAMAAVRTTTASRLQASAAGNAPPWALAAVGADSARRLGLSGAGSVVGLIDAGASAAHEQLRARYRGGSASWLDPRGRTESPTDGLQGHGTGILSVAVGGAPGGHAIGVAPGARWVACVGLPEGRYDVVAVTECAEWILTRAQPDVLINPWLIADVSCDRSLERIVNAWRAAEILPVFAAGNEGPAPRTGGSPANYVGLYPGGSVALSVGGARRDGRVYTRSSRGPNVCDGSTYPVVVAPAEDLTVAFPLSPAMYVRTSGTSYAAGLVAGAAALLLERHPDASVAELEEAVRAGARDRGRPGPDNDFGLGALDVPRAIAALDRIRSGPPPAAGRSDDLRPNREQ